VIPLIVTGRRDTGFDSDDLLRDSEQKAISKDSFAAISGLRSVYSQKRVIAEFSSLNLNSTSSLTKDSSEPGGSSKGFSLGQGPSRRRLHPVFVQLDKIRTERPSINPLSKTKFNSPIGDGLKVNQPHSPKPNADMQLGSCGASSQSRERFDQLLHAAKLISWPKRSHEQDLASCRSLRLSSAVPLETIITKRLKFKLTLRIVTCHSTLVGFFSSND